MTAGAAKEPACKPPVGNTVLVVPKKKPTALASTRTPRKHAEAGVAKGQDAGKPAGEVVSSSTTPAEAAEATSPAEAADSEKPLSAQGEPDGAHGMQAVNEETAFKELQVGSLQSYGDLDVLVHAVSISCVLLKSSDGIFVGASAFSLQLTGVFFVLVRDKGRDRKWRLLVKPMGSRSRERRQRAQMQMEVAGQRVLGLGLRLALTALPSQVVDLRR
jgi:hypothetical protein